jgi:hypothetical protein
LQAWALGYGTLLDASCTQHFVPDLRQVERVEEVEGFEERMRDSLWFWIEKSFLFKEMFFGLRHSLAPE